MSAPRGPDEPAFGWRGLLIDLCRHWISPEALHRTLDAMALARLNVLHLHLSDDQAHRVESRVWPRLHTVAHDGRYLTHDEVRELLDHASRLGIRVMPELDMPGHTTAWLAAYPHLVAEGTVAPPEAQRALGIATIAIDPERDSTFEFLSGLFDEVVGLFRDTHLHLGGDEVSADAWPGRTVADVQAAFTDRVVAMALERGRTPVLWDEAWHPELDHRVVVQVWRGHRRLRAAADAGWPVILSTPYYLDLGYHPRHHRVAPSATAADWRAARTTLWADPAHGHTAPLIQANEEMWELGVAEAPDALDANGLGHVLGGEACMWTELCPEELLDLRLWPTAIVVADALHDGVDSDPDARDPDDALHARLESFEAELRTVGIDLAAQRRQRWVELADGDEATAGDLATMATACTPATWYFRHSFLPDQLLDQPFDRFVDTLSPWAHSTSGAPEVRAAAARLVERLASTSSARLAEVAHLAERVAVGGDGDPEVVGEVVVRHPSG